MFSTILTTIFFKFIDHQIIADCLIVHPVFYDILSDLSTLLLIFGQQTYHIVFEMEIIQKHKLFFAKVSRIDLFKIRMILGLFNAQSHVWICHQYFIDQIKSHETYVRRNLIFTFNNILTQLFFIFIPKWQLTSQHRIERHCSRPNIHFLRDIGFVLHQFRSRIAQRPTIGPQHLSVQI